MRKMKLFLFTFGLIIIQSFSILGLTPQQYCEILKAKGGNYELLNSTSTPLVIPNPNHYPGGASVPATIVVFMTEEKSCVNGDFVIWRYNGQNGGYSCLDGRGNRYPNNQTSGMGPCIPAQ